MLAMAMAMATAMCWTGLRCETEPGRAGMKATFEQPKVGEKRRAALLVKDRRDRFD